MPNQHRINIDPASLGNGGGLPTTTSSFLPDLLNNNRRPTTTPLLRTRRQRVLWAVALGGFVFFLFLFSHTTPPVRSAFTPTTAGGGAPSPKPDGSSGLSGLFSGGGIKASPPEGEYDAHGTGESFGSSGDAGGAHGGDDDIDKEKDERELEAELGFSEPEPVKEEPPTPPHLEPASRQKQLVALVYFLVEGGIVSNDLDYSQEITLDQLVKFGGSSKNFLKKVENAWAAYIQQRYPLVIFSKSFCPYSKKAKSIIATLEPKPQPLIIEVDQRPDTAAIKALLIHLTGRSTFPNVVLGFTSIGGGDDIELLFAEGGLQKKFKSAGIRILE